MTSEAPTILPAADVDAMVSTAIATYQPADAGIADLRERFMPLVVEGVEDREGLRRVHDARMVVKAHRVAIEKTRKDLKAGALEYGRRVDDEAKRLKALLEPIETHLQAEEERIAAEKAAIKAEEERRRKAKLDERVAALAEVGYLAQVSVVEAMTDQDFEEELAFRREQHEERQAREAEERARREAEQAAERERAEKERAELQRLRAEQVARDEQAAKERKAEEQRLAKEREALEAERRKVEEERQAIERERELEHARKEAAEQAKREAEEEAQRRADEEAERERIQREREREEAEAQERQRKAEEEAAARREAMRPDAEKLRALAGMVEDLGERTSLSAEVEVRARDILDEAAATLRDLAEELEL